MHISEDVLSAPIPVTGALLSAAVRLKKMSYEKIREVAGKAVSKAVSSFVIFCLLFTVFCLLPAVTFAHKVNIYAYAENGMVYLEGYFVDGTKCKNSIVEVFDEKDGMKLLEGKTDKDGRFSFKIPKVVSLKLVLHASIGHRAEYTLGEDEVREAMGIKSQEVKGQESGVRKRSQD